MGKVISFVNQKGGVGKTTSAINIAASLGILGYRVLVIDFDPQGNATSGLGVLKRNLKKTASDLITTDTAADEVIQETVFENLSIIPSNRMLAGAEHELQNQDFTVLRKKIAPVRDKYDYIIIDCAPSLGMLSANALTASDGVVIPMQCEFFALEGLSQLMATISQIKKISNPDLSITGILITMYNSRLFLSTQVISELRKHYQDKIFETPISRNVKAAEAPGFGKPVYYHEKNAKSSKEYMNVAKELAERI